MCHFKIKVNNRKLPHRDGGPSLLRRAVPLRAGWSEQRNEILKRHWPWVEVGPRRGPLAPREERGRAFGVNNR